MQRTGTGGAALLVWIAGGVIALLGAMTFAELGAMMPRVGGQFAVIREAFGRRVGFVSVASVTFTVQCGAIGILALICSENVFNALGVKAGRWAVTAGALGTILVVWAINVAGVRLSARVLRVNVGLKLVTVSGIILLAVFAARPERPAAFAVGTLPGPHVFVYALIPTLFSYGGFEQVLWAAGEIRRPERNLALGILAGVAVVVIAYVGINVAFLWLLGPAGVGQDSLVAARAVEAGAPGWGWIVALAVAVSALGTTHAIMLTSPRQILALARDGLAPAILGRVSPRAATPVAATSVIAAVSGILVVATGSGGLSVLLDAVICVNWVFFGVTAASLVALRRNRPELPRPFRVPGYPVTPVLFALVAFAAAASPFFQDEGRLPAILSTLLLLTLGILSRLWIQRPKDTESG
jgi:amino acid transporter